MDEEAKQLRFEPHRDTYIPVAALKGLVKIGLTLIPDVETQHFRETYDWIRDADHSRNFVAEFPVFRTFIPGPMRNDLIVLILMRRRVGIDTVPYAFFTFAYGNHVLQVFLPSISQNKCINGKPLSLPAFPTPGAPDPARYGHPTVRVEHLTDRQPVKGEKMPAVFGFDHIVETKSENTPDGPLIGMCVLVRSEIEAKRPGNLLVRHRNSIAYADPLPAERHTSARLRGRRPHPSSIIAPLQATEPRGAVCRRRQPGQRPRCGADSGPRWGPDTTSAGTAGDATVEGGSSAAVGTARPQWDATGRTADRHTTKAD